MELPNSPIMATSINPGKLILFSKPKAGKTTVLSLLPGCLIIDLERGSGFVDALKLQANSLDELLEIAVSIEEKIAETKTFPYKYIALDTVTALEEMIIPLAGELYRSTPQGKNWGRESNGTIDETLDIRDLPNGAGYRFVRDAFFKVINRFEKLCEHLILVGHLKETMLQKNGVEFTSLELDLIGKLKSMTSSRADAIGYLYRKGKETRISFESSEQVICGSRSKHLRNTDIVIAESDETGNIVKSYWDKVYLP